MAKPRASIRVSGARTHNLRNLAFDVPRGAITVFTGVSGSGKTSIVFDTIAAEAQRQLNETFSAFVRNRLPHVGRPDVDSIDNLSPVVVIDQRRLGGNARSTVGTITDTYVLLRLLFSRIGEPHIGEATRFSFNDPTGMCLVCSGLGQVVQPAPATFLDLDLSLQDGAILLPGFGNGQYWYRQYADIGSFDARTPLRDWSEAERHALIHGGEAAARLGRQLPEHYEGLLERFERVYLHAEGELSERKQSVIDRFTTSVPCGECGGQRLNAAARAVQMDGQNISAWTAMEIGDLVARVQALQAPTVAPVIEDLLARLRAMVDIGLGYLSLDRATGSLSGGESQRIKMVRHLGSSLTEMIYVFDEPSMGLHPHDVDRLTQLLRQLRDKGNTLLVVEHDPDVIAIADHVIDLGPSAGRSGGRIVFEGDVEDLAGAPTLTGQALLARLPVKSRPRAADGFIPLHHGRRNNLQDISLSLPARVLTAITGVAGSGKSSLVSVLIAQHPETLFIDQSPIGTSRRSNIATYVDIAEPLRKAFAAANRVSASLFSTASRGACPECRGLGEIHTDLAFMEGVNTPCEACGGKGFLPEVLAHRLSGRSIAQMLELTVDEARDVLKGPEFQPVLEELARVGVGYLTLGQTTSTLSGGECQRLKLAAELHRRPRNALYVLDEPTTGLHLADVGRLVSLLDDLVDRGNSVIVIEHNPDVIRRADWIIDMGPGAGHQGGRVIFEGTPEDILKHRHSLTAEYLRRAPALQTTDRDRSRLQQPARTAT